MTTVATIGYEGASISEFVAALKRGGVSVLVDVRDVPWSRKPDFCKFPLSAVLNEAGIEYTHLQALGNPEDGRDAAKSGDVDLYRSIYASQLASEPAAAALAEVTALAANGLPCLMCLERDPKSCHRIMIAETLESRGLAIRHLSVQPDLFIGT